MPAILVIKRLDAPVAASGGRWLRGEIVEVVEADHVFGRLEVPGAGRFVHFTVTDVTVSQMQQYLQAWNRLIDMTVIAGPDPQGFRRINVRNNRINASRTIGGWTEEQTNRIIERWNELYPTTNLETVEFPQYNVWTCQGTFTQGQADEFEQTIVEAGLGFIDKRRVWYITPQGMDLIDQNGGSLSGTAQQLGQILRDGTLD